MYLCNLTLSKHFTKKCALTLLQKRYWIEDESCVENELKYIYKTFMHVSFNVRSYLNNYFLSLFIRHTHHHTLFHQINQTDSTRATEDWFACILSDGGTRTTCTKPLQCTILHYSFARSFASAQLFQAFEKITTCGNECKEVWTAGRPTV